MRPHRRQPTRLLCPWDSPGKSTGVGCPCLLQCMKVKSESEVAQSCPTLSNAMDCSPPGPSAHGIRQARVLEWIAIDYLTLLHKWPLPSPLCMFQTKWASQVALVVTNMAASAGDIRNVGSIPGSGRSPGGGHGNPFQNSFLENPRRQRSLAGYRPRVRHDLSDWACSLHEPSYLPCASGTPGLTPHSPAI